jgi:hypothetical protein
MNADPSGSPRWSVLRFGEEAEPVVVIDDFFPMADRLRDHAAIQAYQPIGPYFPGVRAPAPREHLAHVQDLLLDVLKAEFGYGEDAGVAESNYSLVTTRPEALQPIQRLPHYDGVDPRRIALLHYLCEPEKGGTAFYRHRATGFETVTQDRFERYKTVLEAEIAEDGPPSQRYFTGDNARFERIGAVEARQNRAALYRGVTLHSGDIPNGFGFAADAENGRLTVNSFLLPRG